MIIDGFIWIFYIVFYIIFLVLVGRIFIWVLLLYLEENVINKM